MKLKGKLIIIGGAEDKGDKDATSAVECDFLHNGILHRLIEESRHKNASRIEIVTTASLVGEEIGKDYTTAFRKLKAQNTGVLHIEEREQADSEPYLKRLRAADAVFFTGGDQLRLTSIIGGTEFFNILLHKLKSENFIYAGTSAGAAAASTSMIMEGNSTDAIKKGEIKTATGFGLIENVVFDTHFITRGRIGRLFQIIVSNPKILGIGLEENSALLFTGTGKMEAIGPGMCIIVDGRFITETNLLDVREGIPLSIDNMTMHVMSKTDEYDLTERKLKIITPKECRIE